mmetsp:Transcript_30382/g.56775  ORF Transcript_30382/g.56775 Transcript_30382/m.56775 type:complete len:100 (-) Transcript_30382:104-403(-)
MDPCEGGHVARPKLCQKMEDKNSACDRKDIPHRLDVVAVISDRLEINWKPDKENIESAVRPGEHEGCFYHPSEIQRAGFFYWATGFAIEKCRTSGSLIV